MINLMQQIHTVGNMYIIACDVNTFAKFLWSAVNNGGYKGIFTSLFASGPLYIVAKIKVERVTGR